MNKIAIVIVMLSLVKLFTLSESINYGEPVKFGNSIYMITNNQGLAATEIFKINP